MEQNAKKEKIYAVHDRNLESFLASIGLLEKMKNQEIKCTACGCVVTKENLGFVFPQEGEILVCCDDVKCYYGVISARKERTRSP